MDHCRRWLDGRRLRAFSESMVLTNDDDPIDSRAVAKTLEAIDSAGADRLHLRCVKVAPGCRSMLVKALQRDRGKRGRIPERCTWRPQRTEGRISMVISAFTPIGALAALSRLVSRTVLMAATCGVLALGCSADHQHGGAQEIQEIVDNLVQAGFPSDDIQIVDGKVYVGRDALVTLQASREMLQRDGATEEQYRTSNVVGTGVRKICVNPTSSFSSNSALMTGLNAAVANYNALPLSFDFAVGPTTGCDANISITTQSGTGASAGFPAGGLPYPGPVYIGTGIPAYGAGPTKHVIEHELGHCIGFRHSDYYNRSISCGGSAVNEGDAGVGAILIPGTPSTATYNGSVYNSCYNSGSTGTFTSSDVTALINTYPLRPDQVAVLRPGEGYWGTWRTPAYCKPGSWAVGYRMRVEPSQGGGDDTALNSVQILCRNPVTLATEWISSYDGIWGNWHSSATCSGLGKHLTGARMRIEPPQGSGDDTAANDVQFSCGGSSTIHAPGGQGWGSWLNWATCPAQSAVCGLAVRFEESQGSGDDTAMNGLELECCSLSSCGDGVCSASESRSSCPGDCGYCGDHVCNGGETAGSCPGDCGYCGDGICSSNEVGWCSADCGGGGGCLAGEDPSLYPLPCENY
jgi:hypothetical protein